MWRWNLRISADSSIEDAFFGVRRLVAAFASQPTHSATAGTPDAGGRCLAVRDMTRSEPSYYNNQQGAHMLSLDTSDYHQSMSYRQNTTSRHARPAHILARTIIPQPSRS